MIIRRAWFQLMFGIRSFADEQRGRVHVIRRNTGSHAGGGHKMIQNQNGKIEGSRTKRTRKSETSINDDEGHG